jgi:hypothetical protein
MSLTVQPTAQVLFPRQQRRAAVPLLHRAYHLDRNGSKSMLQDNLIRNGGAAAPGSAAPRPEHVTQERFHLPRPKSGFIL